MGKIALYIERLIKIDFKKAKKTFRCFIIFIAIVAWLFSGWPQIWPLGELGVNETRIPSGIQKSNLSPVLLTDVLVLNILKIVNPPARRLRTVRGFLFCLKIVKITIVWSGFLVSSDTDLIPALTKVRSMKKKIEYIGFSHKPSYGLITHSDIRRLLTKDDIQQFLL